MDDENDPWAASDGLPEVADDDSYADGDRERRRDPDDMTPLPPDREDGPRGLDEYGVFPDQGLRGEPLDGRLAREQPDVSADRLQPDPRLAQDIDLDASRPDLDGERPFSTRPDPPGRLADDTRLLAEDEAIDPQLDSQVSLYDRPVPGIGGDAEIGELSRPGPAYMSREPDEIALDEGQAPGGLGNEELAMHEMPAGQADLEDAQASHEPYLILDEDAELDGPIPPGSRVVIIRTGAEQPWDPEDLAVAEGRDPTPRNIERARRELEEWGPAAIEKTVP